MSSKRAPAGNKRNKKGMKGSSGPAPQVVRYNGPVKLPSQNEQLVTVNLASVVGLQTTSASNSATFNTVLSASDVTSATDWGDYKSLYQEARVIAMGVKYIPKFENAIAASAAPLTTGVDQKAGVTPLWLCVSHGEATALTTTDQAVNHMDRKEGSINRPLNAVIRMKETDEAQWFSTQSGTIGNMSIKPLFITQTVGATDVVNWGYLIQTWAVQFKTRVVSATAVKSSQKGGNDSKSGDGPKKDSKSWF